jgi:hypothetical protein
MTKHDPVLGRQLRRLPSGLAEKTVMRTPQYVAGLLIAISLTAMGACGESYMFAPPTIRSNEMFPPAIMFAPAMQAPMPNVRQLAPNRFRVGRAVNQSATAEQQHADWCWAAAVSLVLRYQGIVESQAAIVHLIHPENDPAKSQAATLGQIVRVLNRYAVNYLGRPSAIVATPFQNDAYFLIQDLSLQWPPLIGLRNEDGADGHVYVLVEADYGYAGWNQIFLYSVKVYDPWPGDGGWKELSGEDIRERIQFAVRLRVAHG